MRKNEERIVEVVDVAKARQWIKAAILICTIICILCCVGIGIIIFIIKNEYKIAGNTEELKHWLAEGVHPEELVLDGEDNNPFNNNFPVVTFWSAPTLKLISQYQAEHPKPVRIYYFPDASEVTLHFETPLLVSLVSVKSPSGEMVEVIQDPNSESYYYMNLEEEGYYLVEFRNWYNSEKTGYSYLEKASFYWMR